MERRNSQLLNQQFLHLKDGLSEVSSISKKDGNNIQMEQTDYQEIADRNFEFIQEKLIKYLIQLSMDMFGGYAAITGWSEVVNEHDESVNTNLTDEDIKVSDRYQVLTFQFKNSEGVYHDVNVRRLMERSIYSEHPGVQSQQWQPEGASKSVEVEGESINISKESELEALSRVNRSVLKQVKAKY